VEREGLLYGLAAYVIWGVVPLYFAAVKEVPAIEMLAHRIVWSVVFLSALLTLTRRWSEVRRCLASGPNMRRLLATTILIAVNWLVFIHGVNIGQVVQTSLGYFILPLVSILLGMVFLGERLRPFQWLAVALASAGVANLVFQAGDFPWIASILAVSFSLYGLLRKQVAVDGLIGLSVETMLLLPLAAGFLLWLASTGKSSISTHTATLNVLVLLSGVVTTVPLWCFGEAARRLPLITLGFLQYLSPSLALIVAVTCLDEEFGPEKQWSFAFIWAGLAVFTLASLPSLRGVPQVNVIESQPFEPPLDAESQSEK
jgi:chloramphenicol-sensitive protein RarD